MKKEFAIVLGLALLIALMPYASATTSVEGPETVHLGSSFGVAITSDDIVEAAYVVVTFPPELDVESISVDPDSSFSYSNYQSGTGFVDIIVAQEGPAPIMPTLAEINFTATGRGNYTINLSSVINGEEDEVGSLAIEVTVPWDVNNDGVVNFLDLVDVIVHWGESDTVYDVDRNGEVGYSDLSLVVEHLA
uniref:Dockerin domain-containing protein n=1 Tax=Candidatus Methanophaga sp. ANME-1 ERB7 TaxID=2759913 RepID=A0A7G9Z436_9EURY|nr:hypothetical protein FPOEFMDM_00005 [Methanosarcinales archaeon ANME-1 ERB7]QNO55091.1 hypothetical protein MNNOGLJF_00005 [Methanosarcinales archaeon ANME-1 ERB7]